MIDVLTLTDGGQSAADVAARVAAFLSAAKERLDIALYDFSLSPKVAEPVVTALRDAHERGVAVRLVYNVDHDKPIPVPPPPHVVDEPLIASCAVPARAIPGIPDLMHHKYVVRDGRDVWAGSTNWTDDSWTREENVIVVVGSPLVAAGFARDFEELWSTATVAGTGSFDPRPDTAGGTSIQPWFSPGRGRRIAHRIAGAIGRAERRVRVCSPVITAGPILGTLAEVAASGKVDLAGVFDATQMDQVKHQWRVDGHAVWKIPTFESLAANAPFGGKRTTPYRPDSVHDYMHAKVTVADDTVFIGSYNLSHSGEENAENVLEIQDPALAEQMAGFIDELRARYSIPE